jgi:uncharacterized membrane protein
MYKYSGISGMQKLSTSIIEELLKRVITFFGAVGLNFVVLPFFGFREPTFMESFYMTLIFVMLSLTVGITIRRMFTKWY